MVQNILTLGDESGILVAADLPGNGRYSQGATTGAPRICETGGNAEVAMAEIAGEFISSRQAAERAGLSSTPMWALLTSGGDTEVKER